MIKSKSVTLRPQRLLGEALEFSCRNNPSKIAAIYKGEEYSYNYLKESAENFAFHLVNEGIKKGDRVAIVLNNSWESIVSIYGITLAGGVFLVINPQIKAQKMHYILNDCNAKIIISENSLINELSLALIGLKNIHEVIISGANHLIKYNGTRYSDFEEIISIKNMSLVLPKIIPQDLAALIYTSGSTGFPKGVMMTHQSMVFTSWSLLEYLRLTEEERIMLVLPLAFDYGLYQLIMSITIGGTLIIEHSCNFLPTIFKQIKLLKPTVFPGVPSIYAMMIAIHKKTGITFDCIEKITNTAAALPEEFVADLKLIFPNALIFKMYGLTECKRVCYLEPELNHLKPNSVGKAIPGTEVFLLSPEGKLVEPGEIGILHIRGPHIMAGYWNKEELSKEMLKPGLIPGERILCAHDLFKMDDEGFLYFMGRNDDIIKTRGEKVSPIEVENAIYKIKGVNEVAVVGIPDVILGESIIAFVTTYGNLEMSEKEIQRECMSQLEPFMVPQRILFLPEMPKSTNGKIDKKELKGQLYAENKTIIL
ncbi:MAG TPA: AMP-binding protein [Prolixibacteraceae bacterium]|nr:AMP-binding protein [Prolixibacteraceae bacterium]